MPSAPTKSRGSKGAKLLWYLTTTPLSRRSRESGVNYLFKTEAIIINTQTQSGGVQNCAAVFATVHAIASDGILLRYDGENAISAPVNRIEQYLPILDERVLALRFAGGTVVLGKVI